MRRSDREDAAGTGFCGVSRGLSVSVCTSERNKKGISGESCGKTC